MWSEGLKSCLAWVSRNRNICLKVNTNKSYLCLSRNFRRLQKENILSPLFEVFLNNAANVLHTCTGATLDFPQGSNRAGLEVKLTNWE